MDNLDLESLYDVSSLYLHFSNMFYVCAAVLIISFYFAYEHGQTISAKFYLFIGCNVQDGCR